MTGLRLGLPSKGRLQADAIAWLGGLGIDVVTSDGGRAYAGHVTGIEGVSLVLMSAGEIPREMAAGRLDLGLTGRDMIRERLPGWADRVEELAWPGFGAADLVLAVPKFWIDVETVDDLDAAAAAFRASNGHRLRIATKYHVLVRQFLARHQVADYQLVDSQGATEGTIRNQLAEAIADITTSGATLDANHLKVLGDGLILRSEAVLFARAGVRDDPGRAAVLNEVQRRLDGAGSVAGGREPGGRPDSDVAGT